MIERSAKHRASPPEVALLRTCQHTRSTHFAQPWPSSSSAVTMKSSGCRASAALP